MSNTIFKFESLQIIILGNTKILETHNFFSKYETAIAFGLLAVQYIFIAIFPNSQGSDIEKNYIYLWFFDVFLAIPIIILIYFPDRIRRIILILILIAALVYFFSEFGFNSVYFNTFIAIFLANHFLFFNLNPDEKTAFGRAKTYRFFLVFPVGFVVTVTESVLDKIGILHHEKVGDGVLMSTAGKVFLFVGYYSIVAYLEYRKVKYPNSKFFL
ncbi:hypothetical protein [Epilithonimonas sp. UC225_85]|uniref:hypothetical protein n=1 Tax=Epilithonimonas sp. UC225_85 TaxID=3350167 RepID=UPI0036D2E785